MTWVSSSVQWFLTTLIIIIKLDKSVLLSDEWMSLKENSSYRTVEILWVFFFTTKAMNFFEKKEMKCQTKAFPHSPWRIKEVVEGHLEEWFHSRSWSVKWKSLTFTHVRLYATPWTIQSVECLQARILEWVAFPFSRGSSQPRNWTQVSCADSLPAEP